MSDETSEMGDENDADGDDKVAPPPSDEDDDDAGDDKADPPPQEDAKCDENANEDRRNDYAGKTKKNNGWKSKK